MVMIRRGRVAPHTLRVLMELLKELLTELLKELLKELLTGHVVPTQRLLQRVTGEIDSHRTCFNQCLKIIMF